MMKLLIAYDGSSCSESALDDLERAGLPDVGEATVLTVAEVWLPPPSISNDETEADPYLEELVRKHREKGQRILNQAEMMAKHAVTRVRKLLPNWTITSKATYGGPAWEILTISDELQPDLIVVGSNGNSVIGRFLLGSVSQKVMTEARCSVRIARGRIEVDPAPGRLIIAFDGSEGANASVEAVLGRNWPTGTEVLFVSATDSIVPDSIGRFTPPVADWADEELKAEHKWIAKLAETAALTLKRNGLKVSIRIADGNPKHILTREAENWHADCIFIGANAGGSRPDRFLLGSTSAAVAARAHCSVEVVRLPI